MDETYEQEMDRAFVLLLPWAQMGVRQAERHANGLDAFCYGGWIDTPEPKRSRCFPPYNPKGSDD